MSRGRVVVVEDDPLAMVAARRFLVRQGFDVVEATDAQAAGAALADPSVDAAVVDVRLPDGANGIDLLAAVRASCPELDAVLWSGEVGEEGRRAAAALDVAWVDKPVADWEAFAACVGRAVDRTRARRSARGDSAAGVLGPVTLGFDGDSAATAGLRAALSATSGAPWVWVDGPPGSGRSRAARAIHAASGHRALPRQPRSTDPGAAGRTRTGSLAARGRWMRPSSSATRSCRRWSSARGLLASWWRTGPRPRPYGAASRA